ncbi:phosphomevalonate kinase [Neocallimastix lanati (nom. inval.)]|nr:phosphomevalonate kinase [Neocallimastix sp. JGI-2020a]
MYAVSAPGKVLVTGGYLVLDQQYTGFVQATSSRFVCMVLKNGNEKIDKNSVKVTSPQFIQGQWDYHWNNETKELTEDSTNESQNYYIQCTIQNTLLISSKLCANFENLLDTGIRIVIMGHNDFYSQREQLNKMNLPRNFTSIHAIPEFCSANCLIKDVNKTGLGSSAAMITALVSSLLGYFKIIDIPANEQDYEKINTKTDYSLNFLHNVAQYCHCLAQGKVGSGFDVSAAVWGSHVYRRFNPSIINDLYKLDKNELTAEKLISVLDPKLNSNWDAIVKPCHIPPGFTMRLADIATGSSTPKMVSRVNAWKKANPEEASKIWTKLSTCNNKINTLFEKLTEASHSEGDCYWSTLEVLKDYPVNQWNQHEGNENISKNVLDLLLQVYNGFLEVRSCLRILSEKTETPIEPESQTHLLDACMECPGVLMAGVPGAGGYDAIFCIIMQGKNTNENCKGIDAIEKLWQNWTESSVCPLCACQSNFGISKEDPKNYLKFIKA